jgi:hypothetical protein
MTLEAIIFTDNFDSTIKRSAGAYRVAKLLRDNNFDTDVIDWYSQWKWEELDQYLDQRFKSLSFIGITNTWLSDELIIELVERYRSKYPDALIVIGGQKPFQKDTGADVTIFGFSEYALKAVLDWKYNNGPKPKGEDSDNNSSFYIDANEHYPSTSYPSLRTYYTDNDFIKPNDVLTIELSRGCKFRCKYCNYPFLNIKKDTSRSEDEIYNELLDNYNRYGVTRYIIADDTFNDRDEKIEKLANVVERLPFEPDFASFIRVDLLISRPQQLDLLIRARVWSHFYGIETFHPLAGKAIGKGMNPDKVKKGLLHIKKTFFKKLGLYRGTIGMIVGLPYEPVSHWQESYEWLSTYWDSFIFWALHISKDTSNTTQSLISRDWEKYGYKEVDEDFNTSHAFTHKKDDQAVNWKADWATLKQAIDFVESIQLPTVKNTKIPNFDLLCFLDFSNFLDITVHDHLSVKKYKTHNERIIHTYIKNKLESVL